MAESKNEVHICSKTYADLEACHVCTTSLYRQYYFKIQKKNSKVNLKHKSADFYYSVEDLDSVGNRYKCTAAVIRSASVLIFISYMIL